MSNENINFTENNPNNDNNNEIPSDEKSRKPFFENMMPEGEEGKEERGDRRTSLLMLHNLG